MVRTLVCRSLRAAFVRLNVKLLMVLSVFIELCKKVLILYCYV